jgi:ketosteroid isomerase-like protein
MVRKLVRQGFRRLSSGEYEFVLKSFAPDVTFCFLGTHALGGEQRGVPAVREYFKRVYRLFPGIQIEPQAIMVQGWPWDTIVTTRFVVHAPLPGGHMYRNEGMQFMRLRWGHAVEDYLYEDTHKLIEALQYLAQQGVEEALAAPLAVKHYKAV